jgi:peptidoglycan/LPS O-acetylase OafA/YrhL
LRSIAIISVLIYHAFPKAVPGGFIGVDVFFVISGFLISQIIIKDITKDKFSFVNFYCRRIKRLYPVLILVLCLALFIIRKIVEDDLKIFSLNTVDASLVFATNIQILMHEKGYFDADIRNNPLLHLWSLGVEEQFYIVWPVLLILIFKYFRNRALLILTGYTLLSFAFSIGSIFLSAKFAFYFPLCRFWQMATGGILGYLNLQIQSKTINNALSSVGLGIILIGFYVMDDESFFPGFWALIPTLGATFIIQARQQSFINKHILSSKPCVWIGKISYSLYLWHWPLLVYSKAFYPKGSSSIFANTFFIIFLTIVASIVGYFLVEDRVRKMKGRKIVVVLLVLMGVVGLASLPLRQDDLSRI